MMTLDQIAGGLAAAASILFSLGLFAAAALRYGVDSRPGIDDGDRRPWLLPTR